MKKELIIALASAGLLTACSTTENQLGRVGFEGSQLGDLPMAAQTTIQQQIGDSQILDIDQEERTGRTVYEVTYQDSDGMKQKAHVAADGELIAQRQAGARGLVNEAAGAANDTGEKIEDSAREAKEDLKDAGREVKADFNDAADETADAAREVKSDLKDAGREVKAELQSDTTAARAEVDASVDGSAVARQDSQFRAGTDASLNAGGPLIGTKMRDLPAAVQTAISSKAAGAEIDDIDKEERTGRTVYEVTFKDEGLNPKMHIAADGTVLTEEEASAIQTESAGAQPFRDEIKARREVRGGAQGLVEGPSANLDQRLSNNEVDVDVQESAGAENRATAPSTSTTVGAATTTADSDWKSGVGQDESLKINEVRYNELPESIKAAIQQRGGDSTKVMKVQKKTIYEVQMRDSSKKLFINEDGRILDK